MQEQGKGQQEELSQPFLFLKGAGLRSSTMQVGTAALGNHCTEQVSAAPSIARACIWRPERMGQKLLGNKDESKTVSAGRHATPWGRGNVMKGNLNKVPGGNSQRSLDSRPSLTTFFPVNLRNGIACTFPHETTVYRMKQSHRQKHILLWRLTAGFWSGKKAKSASQRQRRPERRFPRPTSLPDGRFCSLMLPSSVCFWLWLHKKEKYSQGSWSDQRPLWLRTRKTKVKS